jgi:hypothetical protein
VSAAARTAIRRVGIRAPEVMGTCP